MRAPHPRISSRAVPSRLRWTGEDGERMFDVPDQRGEQQGGEAIPSVDDRATQTPIAEETRDAIAEAVDAAAEAVDAAAGARAGSVADLGREVRRLSRDLAD